jgi:cell division protein FtsX
VAVVSPSAKRAPARPAARFRWDRVGRLAMLCALVALLYLAISPVRSLIADLHLSAQRHAQLDALRRQAAELAAQQRALGAPGTSRIEARNLGLVLPGEKPYVIYGLPNN